MGARVYEMLMCVLVGLYVSHLREAFPNSDVKFVEFFGTRRLLIPYLGKVPFKVML